MQDPHLILVIMSFELMLPDLKNTFSVKVLLHYCMYITEHLFIKCIVQFGRLGILGFTLLTNCEHDSLVGQMSSSPSLCC